MAAKGGTTTAGKPTQLPVSTTNASETTNLNSATHQDPGGWKSMPQLPSWEVSPYSPYGSGTASSPNQQKVSKPTSALSMGHLPDPDTAVWGSLSGPNSPIGISEEKTVSGTSAGSNVSSQKTLDSLLASGAGLLRGVKSGSVADSSAMNLATDPILGAGSQSSSNLIQNQLTRLAMMQQEQLQKQLEQIKEQRDEIAKLKQELHLEKDSRHRQSLLLEQLSSVSGQILTPHQNNSSIFSSHNSDEARARDFNGKQERRTTQPSMNSVHRGSEQVPEYADTSAFMPANTPAMLSYNPGMRHAYMPPSYHVHNNAGMPLRNNQGAPYLGDPVNVGMMMGRGGMQMMPGANPFAHGMPIQMMTPLPQRLEFDTSTGEWVQIGDFPFKQGSQHFDNHSSRHRSRASNQNHGRDHGHNPNKSKGSTPNGRSRVGTRYEQSVLDVEKIEAGTENRTTLMIRNIPNRYTRKMILNELNSKPGVEGSYDFLYLPIDFQNSCNLGYAFVNMVSPAAVVHLYKNMHGLPWKLSRSSKICQLVWGRLQGKTALVDHFRGTIHLNNTPNEYRPVAIFLDKESGKISVEEVM